MTRLTRFAALLVGAFLILPVLAADEKKADDKKPEEKKPETVKAGTVTGKVVHIDETKKSIKVSVATQEINRGEYDALLREQVNLQNMLATEKNPVTRANRAAQIQNNINGHLSRLYTTKHQDINFESTDELKIRLANPPAKFDEKGKVVKYTEKELKELKGSDPKLPGYNAEFSDIRPQSVVQIYLEKKKGTPNIPKPPPGAKKDADAVDVQALLAEYAPKATMIVVVADPPPGK
jgi:hypothetical protein